MLERIGNLAGRRAKLIVAITAIFFLVAAFFGGNVAQYMGPYGDADPDTESIRADDVIDEAGFRAQTGQVLISKVDVEGSTDDLEYVEGIADRVRDVPGVREVTGYPEVRLPFYVSEDGKKTLLTFSLDSTEDDERQEAAARVVDELADEPNVLVGGDSLAEEQINEQVSKDLTRAEIIVFPLLFLLSLLFFRGFVAAALPLIVGAIAIGAFATSEIVFIKELGVGTALAVLIDATIIRALLVPALMEMLGKWNWWAPGWMMRLHRRFGLSE